MTINDMEQVVNLSEEVYSLFEENKVIGIVFAILVFAKVIYEKIVSFHTSVYSYSVERALMTKRERVQNKLLDRLGSFVGVFLINIICSLGYYFYQKSIQYAIDDFASGIFYISYLLVVVVLIVKILLYGYEKSHLLRFVWTIVKQIFVKISEFVKKIRVKCVDFVVSILLRVKVFAKVKCRYMCVKVYLKEKWEESRLDKIDEQKYSMKEIVNIMGFFLVLIGGTSLNCLFVLDSSLLEYFFKTIVMSFVTLEIMLLFIGFNIVPDNSKVYYLQNGLKIFIFYQLDENHYLGGDNKKLENCKVNQIITLEEIEKQKIYRAGRHSDSD